MNTHERFAPLDEPMPITRAPGPAAWLTSVGATLFAWAKNWADHWSAAAADDDLSRLSDAELKHCGLSRDILARDLADRL
jgi:hypothetical protein